MNDFRNFDMLRSPNLWLIAHGWLNAWYELSDGQFMYGKLSNKGFVNQKTIIETAVEGWEFSHKGWRGGIDIQTAGGIHKGFAEPKGFSGKTILTFDDGTVYTYAPPSMWKSDHFWTDTYETRLIRIRPTLSASKQYEIELLQTDADHQKTLLLIFAGIKISMQQQAAAAV
jgi:hypothetical protein